MVPAIFGEERLEQPIDEVGTPAGRRQRPRDEDPGAVADHLGDAVRAEPRERMQGERRVDGVGEVGARIDKRAVQIEDHTLESHR